MAFKDKNVLLTPSITGSIQQMSNQDISFKIKIQKFDVFTRQLQQLKKWFN